jgi:putative flippase GtrA
MAYSERIKRFLVVGFSGAAVNFLFIIVFIELMGFRTYFLKNLANLLAIEISTIYNFVISRAWTWKDVQKRQGGSLAAQFISFNLAILAGTAFRAVLFPILEKWGVNYLINVAIGIGIVASVNFVLYDKFVFARKNIDKGFAPGVQV